MRVGLSHGIDELHILACRNSRRRPKPVEVTEGRAVEKRHLLFQARLPGVQRQRHFPMHLRDLIHIADHHGGAAIRTLESCEGNRRDRHHRVPVGKIELDATRHPRAAQRHQAVLHHVVTVKHFTLVDFVIERIEVPSHLGQNNGFEIFVLQENRLVTLRLQPVRQVVKHRVRIDAAMLRQSKRGVGVLRSQPVGRNLQIPLPHADVLAESRQPTPEQAEDRNQS